MNDVDAVAEAIFRARPSRIAWHHLSLDEYRRLAQAAIDAMGLEREEMYHPTGPEYLVESTSGGEGEMRWGGQTVTKNPDFRLVLRSRYVTEWVDAPKEKN